MSQALRHMALTLALISAPVSAAEPAEVVDAFHAALTGGDAKAASALLAPDALIFEAGHVERSTAEYVGGHLAGDIAHAAKTRTAYSARRCLLSPDQAVIATETVSTATDGTDPRIGTETMVLKKLGAGWRIGHIHWSSRKLGPKQTAPKSTPTPARCG